MAVPNRDQGGQRPWRACQGRSTTTAPSNCANRLTRSVIQSGAKLLVLDFSLVTFMDSSGIGLVMGRFRLMQGK